MNDFETRKKNAEERRQLATERSSFERKIDRHIAENIDPLAEMRAEALLVLGYHPDHEGEISAEINHPVSAQLEKTYREAMLGRILLRHLNARARAKR